MSEEIRIKQALIVGGTHGNEPTGTYLYKKWQQDAGPITRSSFETVLFLANPEAVNIKQRYVDKDLNRCFTSRNLADAGLDSHEDLLAKKINQELGPKPQSKYDLIIDMHTSTADMGVTLICDENPDSLKILSAVKVRLPKVNLYQFERSDRIQSCLRSIAPVGIGIEIGPVAQNVLKHEIVDLMAKVVYTILDVVQTANTSPNLRWPRETELFRHVEYVNYPGPKDNFYYLIHQDLEARNYKKIKRQTPIFIGMDNSVINYEGPDGLCPAFVNEAAYYENQIAFLLARKMTISL